MQDQNELRHEIKIRVWRALKNIGSDYPSLSDDLHQKYMKEAIDDFMNQYYKLEGKK